MKILFLDIDGVLNSVRSAVAYNSYPHCSLEDNYYEVKDEEKFDDVALSLIRKLCQETNTNIVLSSTWRLYYNYRDLGKILNLPIVDKTPHKFTATRGEEIRMWVDEWNDNALEDIKISKYAIVDDDSDMLKEQLPYFVKVDNKNGLSYENYEKLKELLS